MIIRAVLSHYIKIGKYQEFFKFAENRGEWMVLEWGKRGSLYLCESEGIQWWNIESRSGSEKRKVLITAVWQTADD